MGKKSLELDLEVANLVVKGVTDRVKAGRSAKKRGKNVTWSKILVQEKVRIVRKIRQRMWEVTKRSHHHSHPNHHVLILNLTLPQVLTVRITLMRVAVGK